MQTMVSDCKVEDPEGIGVKLQEGFMSLDTNLKEIMNEEDRSGCTAIVAIITSTHFIVANAGDARGILMQGDNTVKPMSFDHKPNNPEETARIQAAGGEVKNKRVDNKLPVSRALGHFTYKTSSKPAKDQKVSAFPDIEIAERVKEQFLLLCCDGIWDVMSNDVGGTFVKQTIEGKNLDEPISKVTECLLNECLEWGSYDNMSAVLVVNGEHEKSQEV